MQNRRLDGVYYLQLYELTFRPNIPAGRDGEDEQETDEEERLHIVCRDTFSREDHGSNKLTLSCSKSCADNDTQATIVWCDNGRWDLHYVTIEFTVTVGQSPRITYMISMPEVSSCH